MESRPFNSDAHETSDYDDDSDDSSLSRGVKKAVPVVSTPPAFEQRSSTPSLFDVEKTEKAEVSLFGEKSELDSEKAEFDDQADTAEVAERLDPDETRLVVQEYVAERSEVIDTEIEQSTPDGPAAAAATADKTLLQNIESYMAADGVTGEQAVDGALEAALQQTAQELGLPIETTELATDAQTISTAESDARMPTQGESTQEDDDNNASSASASQAAIFSAPTNVASANNGSANSLLNQPPATPQPTNSPAPVGYGGAVSPPSPPRTPPLGNSPQPGGTGGGASPNALNTASYSPQSNPNVLSVITAEADNQSDRSKNDFQKGLLVGGVAGYLIGKRRGRIKTEKRLAVVTEKLQKEVTTLQDKVLEKEQQVRRLAAEKSINEQAENPTKTEKTDNSSRAETLVATAIVGEMPKEAPHTENPSAEVAQQTPKTETVSQKSTEAKQTTEKPPLTAKAVEQLPKNELLDVASAIVIEGTSLKKRFESGKIDEKALRRIVAEHIRTGGHAERQLKAEIAHAEQKASPETVAVKPAVGRRQQNRSGSHVTSQLASHGIWESSMPMSDVQSDQPWSADAAIDQHVRSKALPPPRRSKSLGAGVGGIALILLALATWYLISH